MSWQPSLGAIWSSSSTTFRVWSPHSATMEVALEDGPTIPMRKEPCGCFHVAVPSLFPGHLYRYRINGSGLFPDPASRFQPHGVHGPSAVVDPSSFPWTDSSFTGIAPRNLVLYELHVGAFTAEGTFRAAAARLPYLRQLGVTAVELMPVADFPGSRNWGYDGAALFAPARCYGSPDDLRHFVDSAHSFGLAVFLDVVYNHTGPDGAYHGLFSPHYFPQKHQNPWGAGLNFDGPHSDAVRRFCIENALYWVHEFHIDGLRLDATQAISDQSPRHIVAELAAAVRASLAGSPRQALVMAEDPRNLAHILQPESEGGWQLDGLWTDDFHHAMRRCLAGDSDGHFRSFDGSVEGIAQIARQGWVRHGAAPTGLPYPSLVYCIQNHDQIGNRAQGDRLHHTISHQSYLAASVLLLLLPQTPLLFMGQEWAATSPFLFFTDHHPELGAQVIAGRRREFRRFAAFSSPLPDPQAEATFTTSKLRWEEQQRDTHASALRLYRQLLHLRHTHPSLQSSAVSPQLDIVPVADGAIVLRRDNLLVIAALRGATEVPLPGDGWIVLLDTGGVEVSTRYARFPGPGAVVLHSGHSS